MVNILDIKSTNNLIPRHHVQLQAMFGDHGCSLEQDHVTHNCHLQFEHAHYREELKPVWHVNNKQSSILFLCLVYHVPGLARPTRNVLNCSLSEAMVPSIRSCNLFWSNTRTTSLSEEDAAAAAAAACFLLFFAYDRICKAGVNGRQAAATVKDRGMKRLAMALNVYSGRRRSGKIKTLKARGVQSEIIPAIVAGLRFLKCQCSHCFLRCNSKGDITFVIDMSLIVCH